MTFCVGMRVKDGIVGIADTRVTSGNDIIKARKVTVYHPEGGSMFLMTSGLRAVRDKALTYFDEALEEDGDNYDKLYKVVNVVAQLIRRVAAEDREALRESGLIFDINCLIGGQLRNDKEHKLYFLYPQGNWVEIGQGAPFQIIGAHGYGKPILVRTLQYDDTMRYALKVGCLAFDSTRISSSDVDYPLDVVLYAKDSFQVVEHRYEKDSLMPIADWWQEKLRHSAGELPSEWIEEVFGKLPTNVKRSPSVDE